MSWFQYLLQVNLYLILLYGLYVILLKNETFFRLNRIYLLSSGALSFLIPVLQIEWVRSLFITEQVRETTNAISIIIYTSAATVVASDPGDSWTFSSWLALIYFAGAAFFLTKFIWQLFVLYKNSGNTSSKPRAHSFFRMIFVSDELEEKATILEHEKAHSTEWHSADVLFCEFIGIINWFNPTVYYYKKAVKCIHEFIADEVAATTQASKQDYSLLLVSNLFGIESQKLTNGFFDQSLIKRRIIMLHKSKSSRISLLKYGFSIPLFICMLIFSSATLKTDVLKTYAKKIQKAGISYLLNEATPSVKNPELDEQPSSGSLKFTPQEASFDPEIVPDFPVDSILRDIVIEKTALYAGVIKSDSAFSFHKLDIPPKFPGGDGAWAKFMHNYNYPVAARENKAAGTVFVKFVVEKDGSLTDIRLVSDVGYGTGEEAIRLLGTSPKWTPAINDGKPVRVTYTQPINLTISEEKPSALAHLVDAVTKSNNRSMTAVRPVTSSNPIFLLDGKKNAVTKAMKSGLTDRVNVIKDAAMATLFGGQENDNAVEMISKPKRNLIFNKSEE